MAQDALRLFQGGARVSGKQGPGRTLGPSIMMMPWLTRDTHFAAIASRWFLPLRSRRRWVLIVLHGRVLASRSDRTTINCGRTESVERGGGERARPKGGCVQACIAGKMTVPKSYRSKQQQQQQQGVHWVRARDKWLSS